jgi:hypothetical protein
MKNSFKIFVILFILVCITYFFRFEIVFLNTKIGVTINENTKIWGMPSYIGGDKSSIIYVYKKYPTNKYVFIFSKKDSILEKKWKEN